MISLILCTYRPGGLDLFANSFAGNETDYEVVVVDDHPGRVERGTGLTYLKERGINVGWYGKSKPKSYPTKGGLHNAMNTALLHVKGEYTVWISDYTMAAKGWQHQWNLMRQIHPGKVLISGGAVVYRAPKPTKLTDTLTYDPSNPPEIAPEFPWVAGVFETFYWGAPIEYFEEINGVDERGDHCHCWPVSSTIAQAKQLGYKLVVDGSIACHMINHRPWDTPEEKNPVGEEGLWRITEKQGIPEEPEWTVPSPNPFDLKASRRAGEWVKGEAPRPESFAVLARIVPDSDIPLIRELLSYDVQCPASCVFARDELGQLQLQVKPSPLHWSRQVEWPWILRQGGFKFGDKVLDVGGGWSVLKYAVANRGAAVTSLEIDHDFIVKAQASIDVLGHWDDIQQIQGDVRKIPLPDNTFTHVVCCSVLEHMTGGYVEAIREMKRVLKPGGKLLLTMDVRISDKPQEDFHLDRNGVGEVLAELGLAGIETGEMPVLGARILDGLEIVVPMVKWVKR